MPPSAAGRHKLHSVRASKAVASQTWVSGVRRSRPARRSLSLAVERRSKPERRSLFARRSRPDLQHADALQDPNTVEALEPHVVSRVRRGVRQIELRAPGEHGDRTCLACRDERGAEAAVRRDLACHIPVRVRPRRLLSWLESHRGGAANSLRSGTRAATPTRGSRPSRIRASAELELTSDELTAVCPITGPARLLHRHDRVPARRALPRVEVAEDLPRALPRRGRVLRGARGAHPRRRGGRRSSCRRDGRDGDAEAEGPRRHHDRRAPAWTWRFSPRASGAVA